MTKYVIKVVSTAKDTHPSIAGDINIFYYGKNQSVLVSKSRYENTLPYLAEMAAVYGYNRACDAKKSYIYKNRNDSEKFWTNVTTIEKVEV